MRAYVIFCWRVMKSGECLFHRYICGAARKLLVGDTNDLMSIMILVLVQAMKTHISLPQIWVKSNLSEPEKKGKKACGLTAKSMANQPSSMLSHVKFCVWGVL